MARTRTRSFTPVSGLMFSRSRSRPRVGDLVEHHAPAPSPRLPHTTRSRDRVLAATPAVNNNRKQGKHLGRKPRPFQKTEVISVLKSGHKLDDLLSAAGLARSTYFYHQARLDNTGRYTELQQAIRAIVIRMKRCYGYRRVYAELRKQG